MSNNLANEKSPYLLQHAENPVDWHPWGEEALERARRENKPVFLSVGYATCHWCHVMAHESFEDEEVAAALRKYFISIKVDREERPDVDQVYMAACQALTGQGGWPLTVFMTPEGKPFYAGTYFPKTSKYGRPGFMDLVTQLGEKWITHEDVVKKAADQLTQALADQGAGSGVELGPGTLQLGFEQLSGNYDSHWGGFGKAPKFPTPHNFSFLLRHAHRTKNGDARHMVEQSLTALRRGGIFDHVGLGFHRYSVDEKWLVPHFEKMLYDQALLVIAYIEAHQATGKNLLARAAREVITYVLRDMTSPDGGFYAAEDADSEGREGLFYVWSNDELENVLGEEDARIFGSFYGFSRDGNFEDGLNIPHIRRPMSLAAKEYGLTPDQLETKLKACLERLYEHREKRIHPLKDDKIITAWNGMMIAALAKAGRALDEPEYIAAASAAVDFILGKLVDENGRLLRRYRDGESAVPAFLEDYACLGWGLIELYEAGFDIRRLEKAVELTREMLARFWDDENGGLFFTGTGNETLVTRKKEIYDGAVPSGNSVAALNLARLARMTGDEEFDEKARSILNVFSGQAGEYPAAHTHLMMALDFLLGPTSEIVIVGDSEHEKTRAMVREVNKRFRPNTVVMIKPEGDDGDRLAALAPFTKAMATEAGPSFYFCKDFTCQRPLKELAEVRKILDT